MGKTLNIVWSLLTASMTLLTTSLMGYTIMSNHWEVITYDHAVVESLISNPDPEVTPGDEDGDAGGYNVTSVRPMMDGRVIVVTRENEQNELLVRMHAGLWATCYDLTGNRCRQIPQGNLFPNSEESTQPQSKLQNSIYFAR